VPEQVRHYLRVYVGAEQQHRRRVAQGAEADAPASSAFEQPLKRRVTSLVSSGGPVPVENTSSPRAAHPSRDRGCGVRCRSSAAAPAWTSQASLVPVRLPEASLYGLRQVPSWSPRTAPPGRPADVAMPEVWRGDRGGAPACTERSPVPRGVGALARAQLTGRGLPPWASRSCFWILPCRLQARWRATAGRCNSPVPTFCRTAPLADQ